MPYDSIQGQGQGQGHGDRKCARIGRFQRLSPVRICM